MPGFVSLINDSGSNFNPGSKRKLLLLQEGQIYEMNETITVFKPNEQLSYLLENSVLHNQVNVFFKAEGTKTIITSNNFVSGNSLIWRSIFFFYKKDFNERGQKILTDFKKMAETQ